MKIGSEIEHPVEHTLGIVSIKTYRRWLREGRSGRTPGKVGRPRMRKSLRDLILRLVRENVGWGVPRIVGKLRKLALRATGRCRQFPPLGVGRLPHPSSWAKSNRSR